MVMVFIQTIGLDMIILTVTLKETLSNNSVDFSFVREREGMEGQAQTSPAGCRPHKYTLTSQQVKTCPQDSLKLSQQSCSPECVSL